MRVVILTGSELRHTFFRIALAHEEDIEVVESVCEGTERNIQERVRSTTEVNALRTEHLQAREQSERDFFELFVTHATDNSHPRFIERGSLNDEEVSKRLIELQPDCVVSYGCSIVKGQLLEAFKGRFINIHLGLSPYYRGSGTNFWALVNGEPECVGATFMHIDAGVDTGSIIHQLRARVCRGDTPHTIGNRLIADMVPVCGRIVRALPRLEPAPLPPSPPTTHYYKKRDFSEEAVEGLYQVFREGLVDRYLEEKQERTSRTPIVTHPQIG